MEYRLCTLLLAAAGSLFASDVTGDWEFSGKILGDVTCARATLQAQGEKLTGSLNELKLEGSIKGDEVSFTAKRPNGDHFGDFKGQVRGDQLEGTPCGRKTVR
jgi:hypothetical protein